MSRKLRIRIRLVHTAHLSIIRRIEVGDGAIAIQGRNHGCNVGEGRTDMKKDRILGHEKLGEVGKAVDSVKKGDKVVLPFNVGCGFWANCGFKVDLARRLKELERENVKPGECSARTTVQLSDFSRRFEERRISSNRSLVE
jgi:hypothetical protein